jgi:hypothetical protein
MRSLIVPDLIHNQARMERRAHLISILDEAMSLGSEEMVQQQGHDDDDDDRFNNGAFSSSSSWSLSSFLARSRSRQ